MLPANVQRELGSRQLPNRKTSATFVSNLSSGQPDPATVHDEALCIPAWDQSIESALNDGEVDSTQVMQGPRIAPAGRPAETLQEPDPRSTLINNTS